jgi:hypothetical protein
MKRLIIAAILVLMTAGASHAYTIALGWTANPAAENVTSYKVYMDGALKSTVPGTTVTIGGITGSHTYYVKAVNKDGLMSGASNTVTYGGEPSVPGGVKITITIDIETP